MNFYMRWNRLCCGHSGCFLALFSFILIMLVLYFGNLLLPDQQPGRYLQFVPIRSKIPATNDQDMANKKRKNVIILTRMRSGSTFIGNMFNLHPDVFYLYEPIHDLRRIRYGNEWQLLEKQKNDAYTIEFSRLIRDSFSCNFQEKSTRDLIFAHWIKRPSSYMSWRLSSPQVTQEALSSACQKRKVTVAKMMQTRLPGEVGIQELQKVCSSDPDKFDCLIIHLVRDPRGVLFSLMERSFFHKGAIMKQLASKDNEEKRLQLIRQHAFVLCSELKENLKFVKRMPHWFDGRYKLIRYEDVLKDVPKAVNDLYDFAGLPMVDTINKWIFEDVRPIKAHAKAFSVPTSSNQSGDHWRFEQEPAIVSLFEERCRSLMELLGYVPVYASEDFQHDPNRKLHTENVPFLRKD